MVLDGTDRPFASLNEICARLKRERCSMRLKSKRFAAPVFQGGLAHRVFRTWDELGRYTQCIKSAADKRKFWLCII
jgi:hypothetical protein